jgi:hypothetical protein
MCCVFWRSRVEKRRLEEFKEQRSQIAYQIPSQNNSVRALPRQLLYSYSHFVSDGFRQKTRDVNPCHAKKLAMYIHKLVKRVRIIHTHQHTNTRVCRYSHILRYRSAIHQSELETMRSHFEGTQRLERRYEPVRTSHCCTRVRFTF